MILHCAAGEVSFVPCRAKLAEALEKVMKAELIRLGWRLVRTHDLRLLASELRQRGSDLLPALDPLCEDLAEFYFTERYPGFDLEDPDWPKLRTELEAVTALAASVRSRLPASQPSAPL